MANTFKNATATGVTAEIVLYTSPATSLLIGFNITNTSGSAASVSVIVSGVTLISNEDIAAGLSVSPLLGKIVLEAAEEVKISSDPIVDVHLSIMEIS